MLLDMARGWPAVLALASVSSSPLPDVSISAHLYQFFADEIYQRIDRDDRGRYANSPCTRHAAAGSVFQELPPARAKRIVQIGIDSGFLTSADQPHIEIHPLCREFLDSKARGREVVPICANCGSVGTAAHPRSRVGRGAAHDQPHRRRAADVGTRVARDPTPPVVGTGGLPAWMDHSTAEQDSPGVRMVEAELAFREGRFHESESLAVLAAEDQRTAPGSRSRAYHGWTCGSRCVARIASG